MDVYRMKKKKGAKGTGGGGGGDGNPMERFSGACLDGTPWGPPCLFLSCGPCSITDTNAPHFYPYHDGICRGLGGGLPEGVQVVGARHREHRHGPAPGTDDDE